MDIKTVTKHIVLPQVDTNDLFLDKLCQETGNTLLQSIMEGECECTDNCRQINLKEDIRSNILSGKSVLVYLSIDPENTEEVYSQYSIGDTIKPFLIVGWSDYEFATVKSPLGIKKRHRGFFKVVPLSGEICETPIYKIPYKHFIITDIAGDSIVREIWAMNSLENDVCPIKERFIELKVGEKYIVQEGLKCVIDSQAQFNTEGAPIVPLREITQRLGYIVSWSRIKRRITLKKDEHIIQLFIGKNSCIVDGDDINISVPPIINGMTKRTYVNLSLLKHILNLNVKFDRNTRTVIIYKE